MLDRFHSFALMMLLRLGSMTSIARPLGDLVAWVVGRFNPRLENFSCFDAARFDDANCPDARSLR